MKIKNGEIYGMKEPLQKLIELKFPVKTSYELAKLASIISVQLDVIEKVRVQLIQQYGTKDTSGNISIVPDSDNWNLFIKDYTELMSQDVEIAFDESKKIKLPDSLTEISPSTLMALDKFIEI